MNHFQVEFIWVLTPGSVAVGYHCFGGPFFLHLQEGRNVGILSQHYTVSQPTRSPLDYSQPWKSESRNHLFFFTWNIILLLFCMSVEIKEQHRLKVFGNRVLRTIFRVKREEVEGVRRTLLNFVTSTLHQILIGISKEWWWDWWVM